MAKKKLSRPKRGKANGGLGIHATNLTRDFYTAAFGRPSPAPTGMGPGSRSSLIIKTGPSTSTPTTTQSRCECNECWKVAGWRSFVSEGVSGMTALGARSREHEVGEGSSAIQSVAARSTLPFQASSSDSMEARMHSKWSRRRVRRGMGRCQERDQGKERPGWRDGSSGF